MTPKEALDFVVYLDRDFVAGAYEAIKGHAPMTQVTKNEGMNAGAKIPFFAAGLSAQETKTFSVSTFGMLRELLPEFEKYPLHTAPPLSDGTCSRTGWIEGELTVYKVVVKDGSTKHEPQSDKRAEAIKASETYFAIRTVGGTTKIALVTTPDYFSSGVAALLRLYETVLAEVSIPVRALVRVYGATSSFREWVGVPLLIYEKPSGLNPAS